VVVNSIATTSCSPDDKALKQNKKTGRPRAKNPMVHTAVVLPAELVGRLKADAEANERGMSAEIRNRLLATYHLQDFPMDRRTADILEAIRKLSEMIARGLNVGWYEHSYALTAFKAGVADLLSRRLPNGDETVRPDSASTGEAVDAPEVVGRTYARLIEIGEHARRPSL
jgi:hypothetical protein